MLSDLTISNGCVLFQPYTSFRSQTMRGGPNRPQRSQPLTWQYSEAKHSRRRPSEPSFLRTGSQEKA